MTDIEFLDLYDLINEDTNIDLDQSETDNRVAAIVNMPPDEVRKKWWRLIASS